VILKEALNLNENQVIFGFTPLGYPKPGYIKISNKKRKRLEDIVEFL
jgi:hypothetical protein